MGTEGVEPSTSPYQSIAWYGACFFTAPRTKFWVVGDDGVEPSTSSLSEKRSTAELVTQNFSAGSEKRSTDELVAQGDEVNFIFRLRYARQINNSFFTGKVCLISR